MRMALFEIHFSYSELTPRNPNDYQRPVYTSLAITFRYLYIDVVASLIYVYGLC